MPVRAETIERQVSAGGDAASRKDRRRTILLNSSQGRSLIRFRGPMIQRMVELGHQVHVSGPQIDDDLERELRSLGVVPHRVPLGRTGLNPVADFRYYRSIQALLRETGADLCLSYTIKPNIWASLAARSVGVPSVSMVTGVGYAFIKSRSLRQKAVQLVARTLYRVATAANRLVIFQNPDDRDEFIATGCLADPAKARMMDGSGVDLTYYTPAPLPDQPIFLMAARLLGNKGVREYAEAALGIMSRRSDARFQLAGYIDEGPDGIRAAELQVWIKGGIEYLGPLEDVRPAIAGASVFVLPSYREGTPRSVLEAMAMGRPIITTDAPGCRETVVPGVNGLLVPPRSARVLAHAIEEIIDRPELRREMGNESLRLCRSKYDVNRVNGQLLGYLAEV